MNNMNNSNLLLNHYWNRKVRSRRKQRDLFTLITLLVCRQSIKDRHTITRASLPPVEHSAWHSLYAQKDDSAFINQTRLDVDSFEHLAEAVQRYIDEEKRNNNDQKQEVELQAQAHLPAVNKGGRPPILDTKGKLALLLYHLRGKMGQTDLCAMFSIVPSACSPTIRKMLYILLAVLQKEYDARIVWPTTAECKAFAEQIAELHPDLPCPVWGFMDGVFFPNENHPDVLIQNAFYNGWKSSTSVTNVLVFTPDGCVCWYAVNRPGSWNDARVVLPLYDKLRDEMPAGYKLVADSAFPAQAWKDYIVTPRKKNQFDIDPAVAAEQLETHYQIVSVRQPAEWGMRGIQEGFQRLKVPLSAGDFEYNRVLITCCLHLFNYRTRRIGYNQTKTVFSSDYISNLF